MKKVFKAALIIFVCLLVISAGAMFFISRGLNEVSSLEISDIDLNLLEDGTYTGLYDAGRFTNEIGVEIKNNKITQLSIIKDVTFSRQEVIDELFTNVFNKQSLDVDTISSATITSKAYLKAIENALSR